MSEYRLRIVTYVRLGRRLPPSFSTLRNRRRHRPRLPHQNPPSSRCCTATADHRQTLSATKLDPHIGESYRGFEFPAYI